ncbi:Protein QUIRKY [Capsicum annuum]|uniref:Protein QUIRKY n=1 Tax=Capsicum annuum TaxID=4072 RepID=A0A2G3AHZ6_CAPAN|nr:Protein QUIRKY [Capsicum annuum]PHT93859.1 Protein QUIRKY [Capsicum annuum]
MDTMRKLIVEVIDARNLLPKDGHGTSSPYVVVDFYGQRRKTKTITRDLSPVWNEMLEFKVGKPSDVFGDMLELDVYHDKFIGPTTRNNSLGRVKLSATQFVKKGEEALIYYPLEKKYWFSWISGEIGLKIYFVEQVHVTLPEEVKMEEPKQAPPSESSEPASEGETPNNTEKPPAEEVAAENPTISLEAEPEQEKLEKEAGSSILMDPPPELPVQEDEFNQVKRSVSLGSIPEVKVSKITGPRPISRASSVSSFMSDAAALDRSLPIERSSFDLVEKMHYIFVRVVKARSLPTVGSPVVKIAVSGSHVVSKPARKTVLFEWEQTFAFGRDTPVDSSSSLLEVSVWDPLSAKSFDPASDVASGRLFLGGICFDVSEIPLRDPPDSPLATQWYRLEGGGAHRGDLMLATWVGTQADESFPEAWKSDTAGNPASKSKVYQSPKLWYLRSCVIEAQDISQLTHISKESSYQIKAQLGFQVQKTKSITTTTGSPSWNEDLVFVAAEPFTEHYLLFLLIEMARPSKEETILAVASIPLSTIERRVDDRKVASRWFTFEDPNEEKRIYQGRVHLRLCFDGGYHVMDEAAHVCSDYRPTARQLWKAPIGTVELGVIGCKNLLPMKGKGSTDAYAVAKYGNKWVRTRTVSNSLEPRWNEQYTWRVYDPSTVLTIGVFDGWEDVFESDGCKETMRPDFRIGKVRVRISTLTTGKVYRNTFPLLLLSQAGLKKMGEIELAVRFIRATPTLDFLHVYSQPLLPMMHHVKPLGMVQQDSLRFAAVKIVASHLTRSEPPLRREVVTYMLDADSHSFSMRKVRANWFRIINVIAGVIDIVKWVDDTRGWKNPTATLLVHALLMMLVWFPDLIIPTFAFYVFVIGAWNYRFRSRDTLPHFDPKISLAESLDRDELDEEFDALPCTRPNELVRTRYDKLRMLGARVQTILGDFATQGERVQALVTWRDPRATGIFIGLCFVVAFILYLVPSKMVAMAFGFYYLRHPIFRDRMPSPALNFFRRLPSLSDRML